MTPVEAFAARCVLDFADAVDDDDPRTTDDDRVALTELRALLDALNDRS